MRDFTSIFAPKIRTRPPTEKDMFFRKNEKMLVIENTRYFIGRIQRKYQNKPNSRREECERGKKIGLKKIVSEKIFKFFSGKYVWFNTPIADRR